ncbi:MAG: T9SS type A sorting domain-containing protein [Rhodothermales bacterium]|nr:T9SS type A sorting domain-containing protein [Rhodothermales bacterium]
MSKLVLTVVATLIALHGLHAQDTVAQAVNRSSADFSTYLPIIVIDTEGQAIPDEPKVRARMGIVDNGPGNVNSTSDAFGSYDGYIGVELRGSSSQSFPKKSFAIETRDVDGNDIDVALLGFPEEEDWVLYAPYSDKSLIRNVLIFGLSNRLGRYATRTRFVELVINNDYRGVYVLMESVKRDRNRVDISKLNPDEVVGDNLTGGYIVKIDKGGEGWISPFAPRVGLNRQVRYSYHYPKTSEIASEQQAYIQGVVTAFEDLMASDDWADPSYGYSAHIDVDAAVDYFILHELARNVDAYRISTYMYKDKDKDSIGEGKLVFGPIWDFNLSFGNVDYYNAGNYIGFQVESGVPDADGAHPPFWWKKLWEDPALNRKVIQRWETLRLGPLHNDSLMQFIDDMAGVLGEPAARNFDRWPVLGTYVWPNAFIGNTFSEEVGFLKGWLVDRLSWMDANLLRVVTGVELAVPPADGGYTLSSVYPNPLHNNQGWVTLVVGRDQSVRADVYDVLGRRVLAAFDGKLVATEQRQLPLDTRSLGSGVYILRIAGDTFEAARLAVVAR